MHNSLLTVEKTQKLKSNTQNKTIQTIKHFSLSSWNSVSCVWAYYGMSCLQLHLLCLLCRRLLSAGHRHLSLWLRTKLLGNCTISLFFSFLANGLLFFLFFHLKEIPCTCQMYCMKVITEPWRKYLNDALVMCCSDNSSFQSTTTTKKKIINYCFIMRMSSCVFILPLHIPRVLWKCHPASITKIYFLVSSKITK